MSMMRVEAVSSMSWKRAPISNAPYSELASVSMNVPPMDQGVVSASRRPPMPVTPAPHCSFVSAFAPLSASPRLRPEAKALNWLVAMLASKAMPSASSTESSLKNEMPAEASMSSDAP